MSDSEKMGRCRSEMTAAYESTRYKPSDSDMLLADAIDRLAADVASIKAKIDAVAPEDVRHFVESEKAWVAMVTQQRDAAVRERNESRALLELAQVQRTAAYADRDEARAEVYQLKCSRTETSKERDAAVRERDEWKEEARLAVINRDEARAEVARLKAELAARQADGNRQATLDSSPAVTEPEQDASEEIADLKFWVEKYRVKAEAYGGMVRGCAPALERAGHPVDGRGPDGAVGGIARAVEALVRERETARAEVERLRGELAAPPPDGNSSEIPNSSPAAPQPAAPAAGWLTDDERKVIIWAASELSAIGHNRPPDNEQCLRLSEDLRRLAKRHDAGSPPVVEVPLAGWLTERERHVLSSMLSERPCDSSLHWADDVQPVFRSILARVGSPPVVEVPEEKIGCWHLLHRIYRDAMDKAGVSWKEV